MWCSILTGGSSRGGELGRGAGRNIIAEQAPLSQGGGGSELHASGRHAATAGLATQEREASLRARERSLAVTPDSSAAGRRVRGASAGSVDSMCAGCARHCACSGRRGLGMGGVQGAVCKGLREAGLVLAVSTSRGTVPPGFSPRRLTSSAVSSRSRVGHAAAAMAAAALVQASAAQASALLVDAAVGVMGGEAAKAVGGRIVAGGV